MKNYDVKQALQIIIKAAKEYDEKLNNKHFLIVIEIKIEFVNVVLDSEI